jgi:site-specific recombinase XerD
MADALVPVVQSSENPLKTEASAADFYAAAANAPATLRAYKSGLKDFIAWCARRDASALPATSETVADYLAGLADRGRKVSTINQRAAAIAYAHRRKGFDPPTSSEAVKRVQRGVRRVVGVAAKGKAPAIAAAVARMAKKTPDTLAGKRDRALLILGFAACVRRSELVALDVADIERVAEGIIVKKRRSKTDQEGRGKDIAVPFGRKLRPVEALDDWLASAGISEGPIFRPVDEKDRVVARRLSAQSVALIVKKLARAARFDVAAYAGHSLRAGFITDALMHGADMLRVMDQSGHVDPKSLKIYDRRAKAFKDHAGKGFL